MSSHVRIVMYMYGVHTCVPYSIGKYSSTSNIGMTRKKKKAANRKGIGLTTLKRACNSTTNTCTKYLLVVMHKTLCSVWLTFVWRENETVQNCPIVLHHHHIICSNSSQTTQAAELTQTRTPPTCILQNSPIKEGTRHGTIRVPKDSDSSYSTHHRNSANDSK